MLWLPAPPQATSAVAVADNSAAALERAVLDAEPHAATTHLRAALLVDPWFCHWMAAWPGAKRDCIDQLAIWFARNIADRLAPLGSATDAWSRCDDVQQQVIANQAASMLAIAVSKIGSSVDAGGSVVFLSTLLDSRDVATDATPAGEYLVLCADVEWRLPRLIARLNPPPAAGGDFDARLEQAKLDAMKELAYGASHEVNNPLANISGRAQSMLRDETDPRNRRLLEAIDSQAMRAHEMISDLMLFARPPALAVESVDVVSLVTTAIEELKSNAVTKHIELQQDGLESLVVHVDPTQTIVAIKALARNAMEAVGYDGRVTLTVAREEGDAIVRVADTGPGIDDEVRRHMFEPFYSGREAGRGLGFGLSKCWRIANQHGGSVVVEQTSRAGTTIALRVPVAREN